MIYEVFADLAVLNHKSKCHLNGASISAFTKCRSECCNETSGSPCHGVDHLSDEYGGIVSVYENVLELMEFFNESRDV